MVRLTVDLQVDFALNQPLSPFALAAIEPARPASRRRTRWTWCRSSRPPWTTRGRCCPRSSSRPAARRSAQMKADGIEYEERMELLGGGHLPEAAGRPAGAPPTTSTGAGHPWVADYELAPKSVVRDMYERAMTFTEYVGVLRAVPVRGPGAALPGRRLQGAAADRAGRGQDRGADRPDRVARRAGPPGRLQPARRVGAAAQPDAAALVERRPTTRPPPVTGNARAFRVLVRNALFRRVELAALRPLRRSWASWTRTTGWDADGLGGRARAVLRRARRDRHRRRTPAARRC